MGVYAGRRGNHGPEQPFFLFWKKEKASLISRWENTPAGPGGSGRAFRGKSGEIPASFWAALLQKKAEHGIIKKQMRHFGAEEKKNAMKKKVRFCPHREERGFTG